MSRRANFVLLAALLGLALVVVVALQAFLRTDMSVPLVRDVPAPQSDTTAPDVALDDAPAAPVRATAAAPVPEAATGRATLSVTVVARDSAVPVPSVDVSLFAPARDESITTDHEGHASFDVESGVELTLSASGTELVDVDALAPAERRQVTLAVEPGFSTRLFGRVIQCEDGAPLAGATVTLCRAVDAGVVVGEALYREVRLHHVTANSDGRFELPYPTWRRAYLWVSAPGFGPVISEIRSDGGTLDKPQIVCADRSASLDVSLTDGAGVPIASAKVSVLARASLIRSAQRKPHFAIQGLPDIEWTRTTDAAGHCRFDDLPAFASMRATAALADPARAGDEREVYLQAGESNELEWAIPNASTLRGRIVDHAGAALKNAIIVLQRAEEHDPCPLTTSGAYEDSAKSDSDGQFAFERVPAGKWWVGPELRPSIPVTVEIGAVSTASEVLLVVEPGLSIRGRVLDPDGKPATRAEVSAFDVRRGCESSTSTRADGDFVIDSLLAGSYRVRASGFQRYADSEDIVVGAGSESVELRLRAGGRIRGRVVDSKSVPRTDAVLLARLRGGTDVLGSDARILISMDGNFSLGGLEPGMYDVWACTSDPQFGLVAGIDVRAGAEIGGINLSLRPGAYVKLRCDDESDEGRFEIRVGGVLVYAGDMEIGFMSAIVPAGPISIANIARAGTRRDRTVTIEAGEDQIIVIGKDP